jgi:hypothetical protein
MVDITPKIRDYNTVEKFGFVFVKISQKAGFLVAFWLQFLVTYDKIYF